MQRDKNTRYTHTPSTTAGIARECQNLSVAPIMGSLPRSLWPQDVVVCPLLPPRECTTTPGPLGEHDEARGCRPQDDTSFPSSETRHSGCTRRTTSCNTSRPKPTAKRRRADKAQSDGLRQRTKNNRDEDGQTSHDEARPIDQLSQVGGGKEGDSQKSGPATNNAEQDGLVELQPIIARPAHT